MTPLQPLIAGWRRWKAAAAREFLRDPNVILFDRAPESAPAATSARGG
ncbi:MULTISPECIES: hypothetical protein [unclassified Sphingobium]